ncbi:MAG: LysR substrate-binding domain-containing protein [Ruminococcus sp.]|jgi:DNA-binding transcriptional LysR family regulator
MDVKDLKCFAAVYEEQSINKAAGKLFITSQGLGKVIQKLEEELDVTLFKRSKKGVVPTESAVFLYGKTRQMLRLVRETEQGIKQIKRKGSILRMACSRGVLNALSFSLISDFMTRCPSLQVEWAEYSNREVKEKVEEQEIDLGIVVGHTSSDGIDEEKIASRDIRLIIYEGHPLYCREKVGVEELRGERIVILNEQFQVFHTFRELCKQCGFEPDVAAKTVDSSFLFQLCKGKVGIGVVIDFSTDHFRMEGVKAVELEEKVSWDIYRICQKSCVNFENIREFDRYLMENGWLQG